MDAARTSAQFYSPGAIIDAEILQPENPIFYGYDKKVIPVRYANGPLRGVQTGVNPFDGPPPAGSAADTAGRADALPGRRRARAERADARANEIRNRAAIVDQPSGKGRVILFAGTRATGGRISASSTCCSTRC